jgi:hypothetical protein
MNGEITLAKLERDERGGGGVIVGKSWSHISSDITNFQQRCWEMNS